MAQDAGAILHHPPPQGPATGLLAGLDELIRGQELLLALRTLLTPGSAVAELASKAAEKLAGGMARVRAAASGTAIPKAEGVQDDPTPSLQQPPVATPPCDIGSAGESSGGFAPRRRSGVGGAAATKAGHRRRSHPYPCKEITSTTLEDGYTWRKYGQKDIQNSTEPRSYYRCTYKRSRSCQATRQAQRREDGSGVYVILYFGEHTCRHPGAAAAHRQKNGQPPQERPPQQTQTLPLRSGLISFTAEGAAPPPPPAFPAPLKQEHVTMPSNPVAVVKTTCHQAEAGAVPECPYLPAQLPSGLHCPKDDIKERQQGAESPRGSSVSVVSHEDVATYMDDLDLTGIINFDTTDDFSNFYFSPFQL